MAVSFDDMSLNALFKDMAVSSGDMSYVLSDDPLYFGKQYDTMINSTIAQQTERIRVITEANNRLSKELEEFKVQYADILRVAEAYKREHARVCEGKRLLKEENARLSEQLHGKNKRIARILESGNEEYSFHAKMLFPCGVDHEYVSFRTIPCVHEERCQHAEKCVYAHFEEIMQPQPQPQLQRMIECDNSCMVNGYINLACRGNHNMNDVMAARLHRWNMYALCTHGAC